MTSVETGSASASVSASASISASSTSSMEAVTSDGLVQKRIVVTGEGEPVGRGAKVTVSYKVFFEGREIDTSSSLTFTQGRKKVIAALDIVVQGMCVGEKAIIHSGGAYAFGRRGLKRKNIGPDSDVEIHVQLLSAEGGEKKKALADMSSRELYEEAFKCKETGNALFKEVKYEKAMSQYSQCIRFVNHLMYNPKKSKKADDPIETKDTKDADVAAAESNGKDQEFTEAAVVEEGKEKEKENSDVNNEQNENDAAKTDAEAKGEGETERKVESEAEVKLEAEVNDAESTDAKTLPEHISETTEEGDTKVNSTSEKVEEEEDEEEIITVDATSGVGVVIEPQANGQVAEEVKSTEVMSEAAHPEDEAEKGEDDDEKKDEEAKEEEEEEEAIDEIEIKGLHVTALNNLSLCLVKMEDYKRAVESTTVALEIDPSNSKAFYYRGRALICLGEWDKAKEDLMAARKLQPNNVGIRMELTKLEKKIKSFQNLERRQAAAMFA